MEIKWGEGGIRSQQNACVIYEEGGQHRDPEASHTPILRPVTNKFLLCIGHMVCGVLF